MSYWLAQLSSQLRLDLQAAFTTSKPPTLNRWRARRSNSLDGPIGMDLLSRADGIAGYHGLDGKQILQKNLPDSGCSECTYGTHDCYHSSVLPWRYHRSTRTKTLTTQARSPALKGAGTAAAKAVALKPVAELARPGIAPQMLALMDDQRL